jgi:RsiW-degrading membrane proteinase PrsW (M82 family)
MGLDVRTPIGAMFLIIGVILALYGLMTAADGELYQKSLSVNINLWWGVIMALFGGFMLVLARFSGKAASDADASRDRERHH